MSCGVLSPGIIVMTFLFSPRLTDHVERDRDSFAGAPGPPHLVCGLAALASAFD